MGRLGVAVRDIRSASSEGLAEWYATVPQVELRREMLQEDDFFTTILCEELTHKFSFYGDQPLLTLKVMSQHVGGRGSQSSRR